MKGNVIDLYTFWDAFSPVQNSEYSSIKET